MAVARAAYQWDDAALVSVEVETAEGFPDSVQEVTAGCRRLLRDTVTDVMREIAAVDAEPEP